MADLPSVVFISCSEVNPEDIIKLVLNVTELPEKIQIDGNINAFIWNIDNKYYTAELRLCSLKQKIISNKNFANSVEAVVIHFDSSKKFALEDVDGWLPLVNEFQAEIKILVCHDVENGNENSAGLSRQTVQEWCIKRGFEFVELEPPLSDLNDELEDDFQETTGVERIVQALNAHVWPNLIMKNSQKINSRKLVHESYDELKNFREHLEESLEELLEKDDDFSQLFSQLSEMKARVSSLSGSDRKAAAEQVVKAFWKALNTDDDDEEFIDN